MYRDSIVIVNKFNVVLLMEMSILRSQRTQKYVCCGCRNQVYRKNLRKKFCSNFHRNSNLGQNGYLEQ